MRCFETSCCIVIPRNNHDVHRRSSRVKTGECPVKECLRFAGWMLAVEDITGDQESIDLSLLNDPYEVFEHGDVFEIARVAAKCVAKVPIGCMKDAQHKVLRVPNSNLKLNTIVEQADHEKCSPQLLTQPEPVTTQVGLNLVSHNESRIEV
jgi:hypothetical protein